MARKMALPKIGVNMTEATVAKWLVKVGDTVADGDAIIEAETDKSTQEIYATDSGIVGALLVEEGDTVPCYADIIVFLDEGETYKAEESAKPATAAAPAAVVASVAAPVAAAVIVAPAVSTGARVRVSPLAKKIAQDNGIDYRMVAPGVPGGRIVKADVLAFLQGGGMAGAQLGEILETIPMSATRKTIAARMSESNLQKPCAALTTTADATAILALRKRYKDKGIKLSLDAILAKIAAKTLTEHRNINSVLEGNNILIKRSINIGVAVDTDKGLTVPVIKNVDQKSLTEVGESLTDMAMDAKCGSLSMDNMSGGTFTITNLGMFGVEQFSAVINPPECCILAVGAVKQTFVPDENGQPKLTSVFQMTLSFDHRIVDGAPAARFLHDFKEYVEMPELMI